tara:strand:- start:62 stop:502 length:441 start_codon:yes stop_codon:yes gene_type:complete
MGVVEYKGDAKSLDGVVFEMYPVGCCDEGCASCCANGMFLGMTCGTMFCCAPQFTMTFAEDGKSGMGKNSKIQTNNHTTSEPHTHVMSNENKFPLKNCRLHPQLARSVLHVLRRRSARLPIAFSHGGRQVGGQRPGLRGRLLPVHE